MAAITELMGAALLVAVQAAGEPQLPGWMAGCWEQRTGDRWTEECWTSPRGGLMLGSSRSGRGDRVLEWESLRIQRDSEAGGGRIVPLAYLASPGGRGWTAFVWSPSPEPGVTFLNAAHDYPQRIRYWREGEALVAEISLADGSRPRRWRFRRP